MTNIKLTLNVQDKIIDNAKKYAQKQKISLSKLVEHYLASLSVAEPVDLPVSPWVKELKAVKRPVADFDHKSGYREHIYDKYSGQ